MDERYVEAKESAIEYLERFRLLLPTLINELRVDELRRVEDIADVIEGVGWLVSVAAALDSQGLVKFSSLQADVDRLTDAVGEIGNSLENQDYTLLADILEYEVLDVAEEWDNALNNG